MDDVIKYKLNNADTYDGYEVYEEVYNHYIKLISKYIKKLRKKGGEEYKIKHIKKYYKIFANLNNLIKIIYNDDDYNKDGICDMYFFLNQIIKTIMDDIFKFIKLFQDDNFDNEKLLYEKYITNKDGEICLDFDFEKCRKYFNIYTHFKHYI